MPKNRISSNPLTMWLHILDKNTERLKGTVSDPSVRSINRLFIHAIEHLKLGWVMIVQHRIRIWSNRRHDMLSYNPLDVSPIKPGELWWEKPDRFIQFTIYAKRIIEHACARDRVTIPRRPALNRYLNYMIKIAKIKKTVTVFNPQGWDKFPINHQIFAKSLAILTKSHHSVLGTKPNSNLSFLLANMENKLKIRAPLS
jgi:hypothetical protein